MKKAEEKNGGKTKEAEGQEAVIEEWETRVEDAHAGDEPERADDFFDKWQRTLAEFDNFRKRTSREMAAIYDDGVRAACAAFLPVIDNIERALSASGADGGSSKEEALYDGIEKVLKQAQSSLDSLGVSEIEAFGKPFDANLHDGVMHVEDGSLGEGEVAEVLQKGYVIKGKVIRHSMVKVAN